MVTYYDCWESIDDNTLTEFGCGWWKRMIIKWPGNYLLRHVELSVYLNLLLWYCLSLITSIHDVGWIPGSIITPWCGYAMQHRGEQPHSAIWTRKKKMHGPKKRWKANHPSWRRQFAVEMLCFFVFCPPNPFLICHLNQLTNPLPPSCGGVSGMEPVEKSLRILLDRGYIGHCYIWRFIASFISKIPCPNHWASHWQGYCLNTCR